MLFRSVPIWVLRYIKKYAKKDKPDDEDENELDLDDIEKIYKGKVQETDDDGTSDESEKDSEEDLDDDPRAKRRENEFYQNPNDQLHFRDVDEQQTSLVDQYRDVMKTSNPAGEDFMKWAEGHKLPSFSYITTQLAMLKRTPAIPDKVADVTLNRKQSLFHDIVLTYARDWHEANEGRGEWPKPLRLFLMGDPGVGKSTTTKATMAKIRDLLGPVCEKIVKEATPTGCASFQLSAGATTVHSLFGLNITAKRINEDPKKVKMLQDKFKDGICLLLIDEFSMVSRSMVGIFVERLRIAGIHLDKMGIIFIGDPAQLMPIGGEPPWSIKLNKPKGGASYDTDSIGGLVDFREIGRAHV